MQTNTVPQFPIIAQWHLVSKRRNEDGKFTRLRVVKNAGGTGNVYLLADGTEVQWFRDETPFDAEPENYLNDPQFVTTRVL